PTQVGTTGTTGLLPGVTREQVMQLAQAGLGDELGQLALERVFPEPTTPKLKVETIQRGDQNVNALIDMNTGQIIRELGSGDRFAPRSQVEINLNDLPPNPFGELGVEQLQAQTE